MCTIDKEYQLTSRASRVFFLSLSISALNCDSWLIKVLANIQLPSAFMSVYQSDIEYRTHYFASLFRIK